MKLAGRRELPFPRQAVWAALMDPDVLSRTLPGCERLERTGEGAFAGTLSVAVGPVRGRFDGTLELTEVVPPEGYRMKLHGEGPSGFLTGEGTVRLEEAAGGTAVVYDLDAQVGGRIAGVGQRLLDSSGKVIARQGLDGLERQLAARHGTAGGAGEAAAGEVAPAASVPSSAPAAGSEGPGAEPPPPGPAAPAAPAPTAPAPTQGEFARQFLRGLWEETVPPAARPWVVAAGLLLLALLVALLAGLLT